MCVCVCVCVCVCRNLLLGEIDREERERCWYFSQLEALSQRLAQLPRIDTVRTHIL